MMSFSTVVMRYMMLCLMSILHTISINMVVLKLNCTHLHKCGSIHIKIHEFDVNLLSRNAIHGKWRS